jgi:hypothetical protein
VTTFDSPNRTASFKEIEEDQDNTSRILVPYERALVAKVPQYLTLVQSDVIGLIAFDLVLWIVPARVMDVALVIYVLGMGPHDTAPNPPRLGIPAYVIADPERFCHDMS